MAGLGRAAKVGLMAVVIGVLAVVAYRFVDRRTGTAGGYRVWAYLPDVTGVAPNSRVLIAGIRVGVIDSIRLEQGKARVTIGMNPDVVLYDDAAIGKQASSFIGEYYIILTPGTEGLPVIPDGGQIKNYIDRPTLDTLQDQVRSILDDVKKVSDSLAKSVGSDEGQERIAGTLENLARTTEQLKDAVAENREAVKDTIQNLNAMTAQSRPQVAEILDNVRSITGELRQMMAAPPAGAPPGQAGEIRSAIERVNRATESLESALQHADAVAERLDRGEGTLGRLTKDETLINEVEQVVEDVGNLVGGIGRLQTIVGLRTDYNFLANTVKSYVELRLQPTEDKYYLIEVVNDPRGFTTFEQIQVDSTHPNDPPHFSQVRTTTTNTFRFSFQFAKRLGPLTGRFGIKESTGGLGLDLHLLDDRFELQQDLFGFGEQLSPRWRVALAYEFIRRLWLLGGMDDILNDDRRDYFVGLQLRFNDQDLKMILPFAPTGL